MNNKEYAEAQLLILKIAMAYMKMVLVENN
jgi:hypothetical protein